MRIRIFYLLLVVSILQFFCSLPCLTQDSTKKIKSRVPPGQNVIQDFPILHIKEIPDLNRKNWSLKIHGECEKEITLDWDSFSRLPVVESISDFHCVTGWSRLDNRWIGVRIRDILKEVNPNKKAKFITFQAKDGYTTSLPIFGCTRDDDLLAYEWEGKPLDTEKGGPVRVVIPDKYGYKSAMWIVELKLTQEQEMGFWEKKGYSNSADPWREERREEK